MGPVLTFEGKVPIPNVLFPTKHSVLRGNGLAAKRKDGHKRAQLGALDPEHSS